MGKDGGMSRPSDTVSPAVGLPVGAAAEPRSGTDAINDDFDAGTGTAEEAAGAGSETTPEPLPATPAKDDARDFFDGKKG